MPVVELTAKFVKNVKVPLEKNKIDYFDKELKGFMLEVRSSGSKTYYYRYSLKGTTHQKKIASTTYMNVNKAREVVKELKASKELDVTISLSPAKSREVITLGQFFNEQYSPYIKASKRSYKDYNAFFNNHILPLWSNTPMNEITSPMISKKHLSFIQAGRQAASANKFLKILSYAYNLALLWEVDGLVENPVPKVKKFKLQNTMDRYLSKEETQRLLASATLSKSLHMKHIIEFLLLTGARRAEVLSAQWSHIDLHAKLWSIPITKAGKVRHIPITQQLQHLIESIPQATSKYIFYAPNDPKKHLVSIYGPWNAIRKRAGLEDVRIHDLRHTFASTLVNSGRSLYEVQQLLGHSNIAITQRYAHLSKNSLFEAASCAGKLV